MTNLRFSFAVLALAATASVAIAQFTYNPSDTFASAYSEYLVYVPAYGIYDSNGATLYNFSDYHSVNSSYSVDLGSFGVQGMYGDGFANGFAEADYTESYITGTAMGRAGGDFAQNSYDYGHWAATFGGSTVNVDFYLASPGTFQFYALSDFVGSKSDIYDDAILYSPLLNTDVFNFSDLTGLTTWTGNLSAGEYELIVQTNVYYGDQYGTEHNGGVAQVEFGLNPVANSSAPAPTAMLPFLAGALLRRRRASR
jgi:hypothetical protein